MARNPNVVPKYELHKRSGTARVRWCRDGKNHVVWLGKHGTPESLAEYQRVLAEIGAAAAQLPPVARSRVTVNELLLAFARHADPSCAKMLSAVKWLSQRGLVEVRAAGPCPKNER